MFHQGPAIARTAAERIYEKSRSDNHGPLLSPSSCSVAVALGVGKLDGRATYKHGPWLLQTRQRSTCSIAVNSTGSGNVIIIGFSAGSFTFTSEERISGVSGGGTYPHPSECAGYDSTAGRFTHWAYTLSSTSNATTITVTRSSTNGVAWYISVTELSFTSGPLSVDAIGTVDDTTGSTSQPGVALTLRGTNDAIVQIINGGANQTSVFSPPGANYSSYTNFADHCGFATSINTTSGAAPTWTSQGSLRAAGSAIAITE
jgi:hypothetical protein